MEKNNENDANFAQITNWTDWINEVISKGNEDCENNKKRRKIYIPKN